MKLLRQVLQLHWLQQQFYQRFRSYIIVYFVCVRNKHGHDIILVEYSQLKQEVNKIAFDLPGGKGKGSCIWEPLNTWEKLFEKDGRSNELINLYDEISKNLK